MKLNKKGFTIVELVIVIAVIAILSAVLIPTFSNVIKTANESSAMQACSAAYTEALAEAYKGGTIKAEATEYTTSGGWKFSITGDKTGVVSAASVTSAPTNYSTDKYTYTYTASSSSWTATAN